MMAVMTAIVCFIVVVFCNDWKSYLFDEEFAKINGLKTTFLEYLLLVLTSLTVVVLIRVAGIILILALLTAPAAAAALLSNKLLNRMLYAIGFGMIFCLAGLWISYTYNIPSGATIIILSVVVYALIASVKYLVNKIRFQKASL
ncbi:Manganese transport system membrane protein MntB [bioreactor metagenome]|uniref:Manganese transport system membrane protein MntB n=1 Tax=bioreactor metagenome TaxID=1076179 RepID=A0A645JAQ1_9ZZZZ